MASFISLIAELSMLLHMLLTNTPQEPHTNKLMKKLMEIASFDPVPRIDDYLEPYFSESAEISAAFD
jgi:hypothetical protein